MVWRSVTHMTIALTTLATISDVRFPTSLTGDGSDAMYVNLNDPASNRIDFFVLFEGIPTVTIHLPTWSF